MFKSEEIELRTYPLPYINYTLNSEQISYAKEQINVLSTLDPSISNYKLSNSKERMLVHIAFAMVFNKMELFKKKDIESFKYQSFVDYTSGGKKYSVIPGVVNSDMELTGTSVRFRVTSKFARESKADYFIVAAIHMPNIKFLGWFDKEDLTHYIKGWGASLYSGSSRMKPMYELPIEKSRKRGLYV